MLLIVVSFLVGTGTGTGTGIGFGAGWMVALSRHQTFREFVTEDVAVTAKARAAVAERTNKRFTKIMAVVEKNGSITNDGVEELFCISDRTASSYLSQLTKAGRLTRQGAGRSTFYSKPN